MSQNEFRIGVIKKYSYNGSCGLGEVIDDIINKKPKY